MVEVQVGSIAVPIIITPRILDVPVTVTQIKEVYSSEWVSDEDTPMTFYLEYEDSTNPGVPQSILYNSSLSSNTQLVFDIPNEIYADLDTYSLLFYWLVTDTEDPPTQLEKVYTKQAIPLVVRDLHQTQ
jgi:hypothetical protein